MTDDILPYEFVEIVFLQSNDVPNFSYQLEARSLFAHDGIMLQSNSITDVCDPIDVIFIRH